MAKWTKKAIQQRKLSDMTTFKKKKILVITPAFSGGSWVATEKILEGLIKKNTEVFCLGLGKIFHRQNDFLYFSIPFPRYDRWGFITTFHPLFSFFWNLPLLFIGIFLLVFFRPSMVITNGLTAGINIAPFVKLFKKPLVVMFHSSINDYSKSPFRKIFKTFTNLMDLVVVNSRGSFQNILPIISSNKIIINEHRADDFFFEAPIKTNSKKPFTIFYAGRLDKDKLCLLLIKIAERLKNNEVFLFIFAGIGEYANLMKELEKTSSNIKYLGYINDREKLRDLYSAVDAVWSYADETYLSLPAVEALACGTPVIIPKIAALPQKTKKNIEIDKNLVPSEIGWLINPFDLEENINLIMKIKNNGINKKMKEYCREYAIGKYGIMNLRNTIEKISVLLD